MRGSEPEPTAMGQEPSAMGQESMVMEQGPTVMGQGPTVMGQEPELLALELAPLVPPWDLARQVRWRGVRRWAPAGPEDCRGSARPRRCRHRHMPTVRARLPRH
jgi:hypothetical protein